MEFCITRILSTTFNPLSNLENSGYGSHFEHRINFINDCNLLITHCNLLWYFTESCISVRLTLKLMSSNIYSISYLIAFLASCHPWYSIDCSSSCGLSYSHNQAIETLKRLHCFVKLVCSFGRPIQPKKFVSEGRSEGCLILSYSWKYLNLMNFVSFDVKYNGKVLL